MKTTTLHRNGEHIVVNSGSDKEKKLRKEGWSAKKNAVNLQLEFVSGAAPALPEAANAEY